MAAGKKSMMVHDKSYTNAIYVLIEKLIGFIYKVHTRSHCDQILIG